MDRTACVDIPGFALQWLLRERPEWRQGPVAVVEREKPQGVILWVNRRARALGVAPGMRQAAGVSLAPGLRCAAAPAAALAPCVAALLERLWCFSPRVEASGETPGVFWLDASGLGLLYPSLADWAQGVREEVLSAGFRAVAAVGFSRFGAYAAARSSKENVVFTSAAQERAWVCGVPLGRLGLEANALERLEKLGIRTLGEFIALPEAGVVRRFGAAAGALHALGRGAGWEGPRPPAQREPVCAEAGIEHPETNLERLLCALSGLAQELLRALAERHEALASLSLTLTLDNGRMHEETLRPAAPTLDAHALLGLCRLRLAGLALDSGVTAVRAEAEGAAWRMAQERLPGMDAARNLAAAEAALARVRAALGNGAVLRARVLEGHLPEARHAWETLDRLAAPRPGPEAGRPLARRIFFRPIPLPPRERHEPDGWLIAGAADGPVEETAGPHLVCGGWWLREVSRAYYYVRTRSGRWLWIYHDRRRGRWFLQGEVQ